MPLTINGNAPVWNLERPINNGSPLFAESEATPSLIASPTRAATPETLGGGGVAEAVVAAVGVLAVIAAAISGRLNPNGGGNPALGATGPGNNTLRGADGAALSLPLDAAAAPMTPPPAANQPPTIAVIDDFDDTHGDMVSDVIESQGGRVIRINIGENGVSVEQALRQARQLGQSGQIDSVNMSLSTPSNQFDNEINDLTNMGVPVVIANGNIQEGQDVNFVNGFKTAGTIAVAALDPNNPNELSRLAVANPDIAALVPGGVVPEGQRLASSFATPVMAVMAARLQNQGELRGARGGQLNAFVKANLPASGAVGDSDGRGQVRTFRSA